MTQLSLFVLCSVTGCAREARKRGWCKTHYMQWWYRGKSPTDAAIRPYGRKTCSVEGCEAPHKVKGFCEIHWRRWQHHGSTERSIRKFEFVTYAGVHQRVRALWGSASQYPCISGCGRTAREWAYDGTDPSQLLGGGFSRYRGLLHYSQWPEFYMPMCVRCHRQLDAAARIRELSGEQFSNLGQYRLAKTANSKP
jgi:hypothetical protein